jgi:hypothetical protein
LGGCMGGGPGDLPFPAALGRQKGVILVRGMIDFLCTEQTPIYLVHKYLLSIVPVLCELPRIPIPRTWVNKGMKKGRSSTQSRPLVPVTE